MTRTPDELVAAIVSAGEAGGIRLPRTDAEVRAQRHVWPAGAWRARWPEGLDLPTALADVEPADLQDRDVERETREITRDEVLRRGRELGTERDAVELYLLMCAWLGEYQDLPPSRLVRPLKDDGTASALLRSATLAREGRAVHAYDSLWRGENRIKRVGPSLFTAWLYFSAYETWDAAHGPAPLILDHRVARVLGWNGARVSAAAYGKYLALAADVAAQLDATPHSVEDALFAVGRGASA